MIQFNCVRQLWTLMVTWCPLKLRTLKRIDTSPPGGTCGILLRADHVTMKPPITYFTVKDGHVIRLLPLGDLIIVVSNFAVQMMKWLKYFWVWHRFRGWDDATGTSCHPAATCTRPTVDFTSCTARARPIGSWCSNRPSCTIPASTSAR